jgi:hypothetical protein
VQAQPPSQLALPVQVQEPPLSLQAQARQPQGLLQPQAQQALPQRALELVRVQGLVRAQQLQQVQALLLVQLPQQALALGLALAQALLLQPLLREPEQLHALQLLLPHRQARPHRGGR